MSPWARLLLTAIVNSCIVGCAVGLPHTLRTASRAHRSFLWLIVFFSLPYLALLIPGALTDIADNRYMAPLVPLLFLAILMPLPRQKHSAPLVAWICLFIMSGYAVAATHDHFEQLRAGLSAAHSLEKAGIGRNRISPGRRIRWLDATVIYRPHQRRRLYRPVCRRHLQRLLVRGLGPHAQPQPRLCRSQWQPPGRAPGRRLIRRVRCMAASAPPLRRDVEAL